MKKSALESWIIRRTGCSGRADLDQCQLERVRDILAFAKERSFFYAQHLADIRPEHVRSHEALALLPFTSHEQLRTDPQSWLCQSQAKVERIVTLKTSGTTADPKRIFFSWEDQERTVDFFAHGMKELVSAGDRVLILMPGQQPGSVGALLQEALSRINVEAIQGGTVCDIGSCYHKIKESNCNCLVGIPVQILGLAEYGAQLSPALRAPVRSVLLSADSAVPALTARICALIGCETFNHFGMTEMGFGVAVECSAHNGCHIRENDILVEVIDPDTGAVLPDGQLGEFVFTTLNRRAMPFIRYRTGDMGMLLSEPCPCGSYIKRMLPWGGRLAENGRLWELDQRLFACPGVIDYSLRNGTLTLMGVTPPDVEKARLALIQHPDAETLTIRSQAISGFAGTGMTKRTL